MMAYYLAYVGIHVRKKACQRGTKHPVAMHILLNPHLQEFERLFRQKPGSRGLDAHFRICLFPYTR